jgi:predicted ester cyclase
MSSEENKQIALSLLEALNVRNLSLWSQHLAEYYIAEHPGVSVPLDKTRSIGYQQRFVTALPNIHLEVLHVIAEGDHVLIHWKASGTHAERLATLTGETIPPTRRSVRVSGALLTEVRDGKIVREWTYWDQLSLLAQLGITDQPGLFLSPEGFQDGSQRSDQNDA